MEHTVEDTTVLITNNATAAEDEDDVREDVRGNQVREHLLFSGATMGTNRSVSKEKLR